MCLCVDGRELKVADSRIGKETLKTTRLVCVPEREKLLAGQSLPLLDLFFFFVFYFVFCLFLFCVSHFLLGSIPVEEEK